MAGVTARDGGNGWKASQPRECHRGGKEKERKEMREKGRKREKREKKKGKKSGSSFNPEFIMCLVFRKVFGFNS